MLYRFAWVLMWITFKIYFRRIDVVGLHKLKPGVPYILIANHPASFLDAMVLAVFLKLDVHFYVRGDIFKHPVVLRVLTWLHMIPIFGREHGMENVSKNHLTFYRGKDLLKKGKLLLIFPEGFSRLSKKMEPMRKGAARVALQTAFDQDGIENVSFQSIALNYSHHGFGADLYIRLGDQMSLDQYQSQYAELPAKAVNALTGDLSPFFEKNVIHLQDGSKTLMAEEILRFAYNDCINQPVAFFENARWICSKIDELSGHVFDQYVQDLNNYKRLLHKYSIVDRSLSKNHIPHIMSLLNLLLTIEIFLFGKIFWYIPGSISKWIADKTVTRIDFFTSVYSGILAFMSLFWWIGFTIIAFQADMLLLKLFIFTAPLSAYLTMQWQYDFIDLWSDLKWKRMQDKDAVDVQHLLELRKRLLF